MRRLRGLGATVLFESADAYYAAMREARDLHLAMVDSALLQFDMEWADMQVADLAHDTHWRRDSAAIIRRLILLHPPDEHADQSPDNAPHVLLEAVLFHMLRAALLAVLPLLPSPARPGCPAHAVPAMRDTATQIIRNWFEVGDSTGLEAFMDLDCDSDDGH